MSAQPSQKEPPPGEGGLREALREALREELRGALREFLGEAKHRHKLTLSAHNENEAYCPDCGARFMKYDGFDSVLELLKRPHGHDGSDFLSCPSCRPKFVDVVKGLGYEVRDLGRELVIRRKR